MQESDLNEIIKNLGSQEHRLAGVDLHLAVLMGIIPGECSQL